MSISQDIVNSRTYHFPIWVDHIGAQVLNKRRETFIEPNIIPPVHGNKVAKPLEL